MTEKLWYKDGLRFKCTGCGDCCTGAPGYVWVNKAEIEAMAAALNMKPAEFKKKFVRKIGIRRSLVEYPNGDCVFFNTETKGCDLYEHRPRQCRTWPFWTSNLRSEDAWELTAEGCPGCNRGSVIPLETIQERLGVLRV